MPYGGAVKRRQALVKGGHVSEHMVLDSKAKFDRWEWEVLS
jgi:hypothetical protein